MKRLYFVRHGLSEANAEGIISGQLETPLTDIGRHQAKQVAKQIKDNDYEIDLIVSSPMSRARQTAFIIADIIAYPLNRIVLEPLLMERNYGQLQGTSLDEFYARFTYQDVDKIPDAETIEALQQRAEMALGSIKKFGELAILVVSHGAFGRSFRRAVNGQPHTLEYVGPLDRMNNAEIIELI